MKEEFLKKCEEILQTKQEPGETLGRGRWRRGSGSGRFINHGIIKYYSEDLIQVCLYSCQKVCFSEDEAFAYIIGVKTCRLNK